MSKERELLKRWLIDFGKIHPDVGLLKETKELLAQPEQGHKFNFDLERMKAAIESPISDVTVDDLAKQVKQEPVALEIGMSKEREFLKKLRYATHLENDLRKELEELLTQQEPVMWRWVEKSKAVVYFEDLADADYVLEPLYLEPTKRDPEKETISCIVCKTTEGVKWVGGWLYSISLW